MRYILMLSVLLSSIFSACSRTKKYVISEKEFNTKPFRIEQCIRKTYVSNYSYYQFVLGKSKPIEVNSLDYEQGLPYHAAVFKGAPVLYFDTTVSYCEIKDPEKVFQENSAYLTEQNYAEAEKESIRKYMKEEIYKNLKTERKRFIRYLDPKKYSRAEFEDISACMSQYASEINELIFGCKPFVSARGNYDGWKLCGLVYGNEEDFCEVYTKAKDDFFKIFPDGRIAHYNELSLPGKGWMSGQDFIYSKIKMPGKIIRLRTYTKDDLKQYKNQKGELITDHFQTEQGTGE